MKKPEEGQPVQFRDVNNEWVTGIVADVLAQQFTVEHNGSISYVFFTENWRTMP